MNGLLNYFVFWLVPLFSVFPMIIRLRIVTEHFSESLYQGALHYFVSRTTATNLLEGYLIGADMQYHFEHHVLPNIPHHQLKRLHRLLVKRGYFGGCEEQTDSILSDGYVRFWLSKVFRVFRGSVANAS